MRSAQRFTRAFRLAMAAIVPVILLPLAAQAECGDRPGPEVDWTGCSKERLMLHGSDLTGGSLENTYLSGTGFKEAVLAGANLQRSELVRSSFVGADLSGANLEKALASRSDFSEASLRGARLVKAEFLRVSFAGADLTDANLESGGFYRNDFSNALLTNANLHDAILPRAIFTGATMAGANLSGAFLMQARIEGTDLSQVSGLEQAQVDHACGDASTILPAGLTAPGHWPCPQE